MLGYIILVVAAVFFGIAFYHILVQKFSTDEDEKLEKEEIFARRREKHEATTRKAKNQKQKSESQKRLETRMVAVANHLSPLSRDDIEKAKARLWQAGITMSPAAFHAMEMGLRLIGTIIIVYLIGDVILGGSTDNLVVGCVVGVVCFFGPAVFVWMKARERREQISIDLPTVLEMLSSAVSAGTTVDRGFQFVAENTSGPLAKEFTQVDRDVRILGLKRNDALLAMSARCGVQSVSVFVSAVIQATEQGASMASVLANQAKRARDEYYSKVEAQANKVPTKMVFPLAMFVLPTLFVAVLAPVVVTIVNSFMGGD